MAFYVWLFLTEHIKKTKKKKQSNGTSPLLLENGLEIQPKYPNQIPLPSSSAVFFMFITKLLEYQYIR